MASSLKTHYEVVRSGKFSQAQREAIGQLIYKSIETDFPQGIRTRSERSYLRQAMGRTLGDPNKGVGGPLLHRRQAYARSLNLIAIQDGEAVAHMPVADNASSAKGGLRGLAEIQSKLHLTELKGRTLIDHRYMWLGYAAMSPEQHRSIADDPEAVNPFDVMIALAADSRDGRQPVTAYPWDEETAWRAELQTLGLQPQPGQDKQVHAFSTGAPPVHQERWLAASITQVESLILAKVGAARIIAAARRQTANQ
jgi:hypothetical protein